MYINIIIYNSMLKTYITYSYDIVFALVLNFYTFEELID